MSAPVNHLEQRTQDANELLEGIMPSAITLAMMLRHRKMATWLRTEFEGYSDSTLTPPYRRELPGHIVARSPQYGWIPAPVDDQQKVEYGRLNLNDGVKALEKICLSCKKGTGNRVVLPSEEMTKLQSRINLSAELAINVSRDTYSDVLKTIRAAIYLWTRELVALGVGGEHNSFSPEERNKVATLDNPEQFWRRAMDELDDLPIPDTREVGFFERVFGRTG
ncbi:hypothetical protein MARLIPOL_02440 [Marinobacter lipolyticus SM19]|uniref:AbiTii domain-containing protein n=1 Tax=Marinobacter lipolyticus SM19 TaxID=1318628 RepID=R8B4K4_9GAMM|nr:hypothetical protein [Marinobacter lipolyticus]EON93527.1 hypothetical protein MARLIPOL_02440 [Marinobacter lipolyticus SM19]